MEWLTNWITREGKGIPKDAPKKTGLALFASTIGREAWELFKLNLMLLVLAVPVVTIPASFAAASRISVLMIEDEVVFLWRDFWRFFSKIFFKATNLGVALLLPVAVCAYASFIYGQMALHQMIYVAPAALAVFLTLFLVMITVCAFTLMARRDWSIRTLLKGAFYGALAKPFPLLAGVAFAALLWLLHVIFYPASIFLPVVLNFSLGTFAIVFGAFPATRFALELIEPDGSRQGVDIQAS